ncbi:zinc ribbon domain-containing protein [Elusimicrobiota bacterium]
MKCPECGYENIAGAAYCNLCRKPFKKTADIRITDESMKKAGYDWSKPQMIMALIILGIFIITGFPLYIYAMRTYRPLDIYPMFLDSLKYSLTVLALIWFLVIIPKALPGLKGNKKLIEKFYGLTVFSSFIFMLIVFSAQMLLNGYNDSSEGVSRRTAITGKYHSGGSKGNAYHFMIESWRQGRTKEKIRTSREKYYTTNPNKDIMRITTKSGNLGYEWILSYKIKKGS